MIAATPLYRIRITGRSAGLPDQDLGWITLSGFTTLIAANAYVCSRQTALATADKIRRSRRDFHAVVEAVP